VISTPRLLLKYYCLVIREGRDERTDLSHKSLKLFYGKYFSMGNSSINRDIYCSFFAWFNKSSSDFRNAFEVKKQKNKK